MTYNYIKKGIFRKRINRFTAIVEIDGKNETVHVKNTGRLKEIFCDGVTVFLSKSDNPLRKTKYDLVSAIRDNILINVDSQAPNKVFYEFLKSGKFLEEIAFIKPESFYKNSRFDFYLETKNEKVYIEVKGVTLLKDGNVYFPDAPTERGIKHINEIIEAADEGYRTYIVFVVQLKGAKAFFPNRETHRKFAEALVKAKESGVGIIAYDCVVSENSLDIDSEIEVNLKESN